MGFYLRKWYAPNAEILSSGVEIGVLEEVGLRGEDRVGGGEGDELGVAGPECKCACATCAAEDGRCEEGAEDAHFRC